MISPETANVGNLALGLLMLALMLWHFSTIGHGPIWWTWRFLRRLVRFVYMWIWWTSWSRAAAEWETPLDPGAFTTGDRG